MEIYFDKPIGKGTCADIWRGTDEIGRSVAIKILRKEGKDTSTLLQHAQALVRAKHSNVVEVYSIEKLQIPGQMLEQCIVMEYVNGFTLAERLSTDLELKEALDIGKAILSGVFHIHSQGLGHMDLHDQNILITHEGNIKIIDIMYMSSLAAVSEKVRFTNLSLDIRQLIDILSELLKKTSFGSDAKSYFLSHLDEQATLSDVRRNYLDIFTTVSEGIYYVDTRISAMKLKIYRFRAECESDVNLVLKALKGNVVSITRSQESFPDIKVKIVTDLSLDEILKTMRTIEDAHVMIQTIAHHLDYTGNRNNELT